MRKKILVLGLVLAFAAPCLGEGTFTDVPKDHWAYSYIEKLVVKYKVIHGYPDNTYRGEKTLNRYEFAKALVVALQYIENAVGISLKEPASETITFSDLKPGTWPYNYVMDLTKDYQIFKGYPDGAFKGKRTLNRNEVCTTVARALQRVENARKFKVPLKDVDLTDLPKDHWAYPYVQKLISADIIYAYPDGSFKGSDGTSRYVLAYVMARFIDYAIARLKEEVVEKPLEVKELLSVSGSFGNVFESASATNNWMGFGAAASYRNAYKILMFSGNYEVNGRYNYNQINYMIPGGMGGVIGGIVDENRYEVELNTVYPIVKFMGMSGNLLLGIRYVNLDNPVAPTDFTALNAGVVTSANILGRKLLLRGFYSYPFSRGKASPSVLGQPDHIFDYEASLPAKIFSYPVLVGFSGEAMHLSGGHTRLYNNFFVRYFLF
jgi:hypothetical protein